MNRRWSIEESDDENRRIITLRGLEGGLPADTGLAAERADAFLKALGYGGEVEWNMESGVEDGATTAGDLVLSMRLHGEKAHPWLTWMGRVLVAGLLEDPVCNTFSTIVRYGPVGLPSEEIDPVKLMDESPGGVFAHPGLGRAVETYHTGHPGLDGEILVGRRTPAAPAREDLADLAREIFFIEGVTAIKLHAVDGALFFTVTAEDPGGETRNLHLVPLGMILSAILVRYPG